MKPELIVMLTHNDQTVANARALFEGLRDIPVTHWGFKDVGLPPDEMKELVQLMKDAGKTTYLEVVSLTEGEGLAGARVAVEGGFDILMGTVFFESINDYLRDKPVKYYPFPGHVYDHPSILGGSVEEIVEHACWLEGKGVQGLDLLAYRHQTDGRRVLHEVVKAVQVPVVSAGSIASYDRIAEVWEAKTWGFTIGSAFFDKKFVPDGDFGANVLAVVDWLAATDEKALPEWLPN